MKTKQILVVMSGVMAMLLGQHATAAIDFSPANISVQESDGQVTITVVRTGAATEQADVTVVSTHGTATVNVDYTVGGPKNDLYKRKSSANDCKTDGCWDYTGDGKVELLGKACDDVKASPNAKVSITVGCDTQVK